MPGSRRKARRVRFGPHGPRRERGTVAELRRFRSGFVTCPARIPPVTKVRTLRNAPMAHCADAGKTRTLHPLFLPAGVSDPGDAELRRGLYVDCETTGFSPGHDAVIELAMLPFTYTLGLCCKRDQGAR